MQLARNNGRRIDKKMMIFFILHCLFFSGLTMCFAQHPRRGQPPYGGSIAYGTPLKYSITRGNAQMKRILTSPVTPLLKKGEGAAGRGSAGEAGARGGGSAGGGQWERGGGRRGGGGGRAGTGQREGEVPADGGSSGARRLRQRAQQAPKQR